jgi:hypothetical protein
MDYCAFARPISTTWKERKQARFTGTVGSETLQLKHLPSEQFQSRYARKKSWMLKLTHFHRMARLAPVSFGVLQYVTVGLPIAR